MVRCPRCNKEMSQRGRVTFKDEKREIYYCKDCNKFYNVFYDIVFRGIEENHHIKTKTKIHPKIF